MRIGILQCGDIVPEMVAKYESYVPMFQRLLDSGGDPFDYATWRVVGGEMPDAVDSCDGWVVTGSRHGVYEDFDWIAPLKTFLRDCVERGVPVIGVCFGHQILAEAMGGKVVKSEKGWGLGVHHYSATAHEDWFGALADGFSNYAIHQDQVIAVPPGATVLATSEFCEVAALAYGSPDRPVAISVQPHPEFQTDYVSDVIRQRLMPVIEPAQGSAALDSLARPVDNATWGAVMARFLRDAHARRTG